MIRISGVILAVACLTCLPQPSFASSECIPVPPGMISLWSGDHDARDVLGRHDGVLVNGAVAGVPGQVGGAFSLDGVDAHIDVADSADFDLTSVLTMEAWIKIAEVKEDQKIISYFQPYEMGIYEDRLELMLQEVENHRGSPGGTALQADTWYHVVVTWNGDTATSYVNGVLDRSAAFNILLPAGANSLRIGGAANGGLRFSGLIDEAAIYSRALNEVEVKEHYQRGLLHQEYCIFSDGFEPGRLEICSNGVDDDGDSYTDCEDFDCNGLAPCGPEQCSNGIDDDDDSFVDCDDFDCDGIAPCGPEQCSNDIDDDGDSFIDCDDFDCDGEPSCRIEICSNGIDDNFDGHVDCDDPTCDGDPACGIEICTNGIDDDFDGRVDCDDADCDGDPACPPD